MRNVLGWILIGLLVCITGVFADEGITYGPRAVPSGTVLRQAIDRTGDCTLGLTTTDSIAYFWNWAVGADAFKMYLDPATDQVAPGGCTTPFYPYQVNSVDILLYLLGVVLLFTAFKLITQKEKEVNPEKNPVVRLSRKFMRVTPEYDGTKFLTRKNGLLFATPLVITLITIETMDIMFAVDSVPAVFGVTLDPIIVYTSNIFAILGLRALFFALAGLFYLFRYLVYGLAVVLAFVGIKMLIVDIYKIPVTVSLVVVLVLILGSILASILLPKPRENEPPVSGAGKKE